LDGWNGYSKVITCCIDNQTITTLIIVVSKTIRRKIVKSFCFENYIIDSLIFNSRKDMIKTTNITPTQIRIVVTPIKLSLPGRDDEDNPARLISSRRLALSLL